MCGIAGIYSPENAFGPEVIQKMTSRLSHRGPDHEGIFREDAISLGHRRLSILDLSDKGNQPMFSADDRYIMVYNGEVYNYIEIAAQLNRTLRSHSDTEVILEAFATWGVKFVDRLHGMFAIAIYDRKEKCIHLWRDRLGIKPVYYYHDGKNFAFASELKALLELPIQKELNREAIKDYLFLESIPEPHTIFKHISKLEKGHYLKFDSGGINKKQWYDLLEQLTFNEKIQDENHYLESFDELIGRSIQRRMVSDVPVGAFLSGGTDSSVICAKFRELADTAIYTFTIGFDEKDHDESSYAEAVARYLETDHQLNKVTGASSVALANHITDFYDEPFAVSSMIPMLMVSEEAAKKVKVVLSGDGGDELFMGYGYYHWQDRIRKISKMGGYPARKLTSLLLDQMGQRKRRAARVFDYADNERLWLHVWSQEQYMFNEKEISALTGEPYHHETLLPDWKKINALPLNEYDKISLFDTRHYLANNLLHKVDIATMSKGLEARVPFLDHELVAFAVNLPSEFKIRNNEQKYLLKKWLERKLPAEYIYRKKWGFPAPVGQWMKKELSHLIDEYLDKKAIERTQTFHFREVEKLVKAFRSGQDFHYKRIWALICYQRWYERYMG